MKTFLAILSCLSFFTTLCAEEKNSSEWKELYFEESKCRISFPEMPQQVKQWDSVAGNPMQYNLYIAGDSQQNLYLLLIAEYPVAIEKGEEELSLQGFFRGFMSLAEEKDQILEAKVVDFQGHKTLDFSLLHEGRHFLGKMVVSGKNLYLIAVECAEEAYQNKLFQRFLSSFSLVN